MQRVRVDLGEREVAEDEPELAAQALLKLLHDGICLIAVRALIVAVLDERDRGVGRTLHVILRRHRDAERVAHVETSCLVCVPAARPSSASRMPSAPGFT